MTKTIPSAALAQHVATTGPTWTQGQLGAREIPVLGYSSMYGLDAEIRAGWLHVTAPVVEATRGRWTSFAFADPADLPRTPACYVALLDGRAMYVGQTSDLRTRFKGHGFRVLWDSRGELWHYTPWGMIEFGRITFKRRRVERYGDWLMHELRLIRRLQPTFNQQRPR